MVRLTRVRVQYLLDDITCSFSPLQAAMAFVNIMIKFLMVQDKFLKLLL